MASVAAPRRINPTRPLRSPTAPTRALRMRRAQPPRRPASGVASTLRFGSFGLGGGGWWWGLAWPWPPPVWQCCRCSSTRSSTTGDMTGNAGIQTFTAATTARGQACMARAPTRRSRSRRVPESPVTALRRLVIGAIGDQSSDGEIDSSGVRSPAGSGSPERRARQFRSLRDGAASRVRPCAASAATEDGSVMRPSLTAGERSRCRGRDAASTAVRAGSAMRPSTRAGLRGGDADSTVTRAALRSAHRGRVSVTATTMPRSIDPAKNSGEKTAAGPTTATATPAGSGSEAWRSCSCGSSSC